jgi:hypothetical protein
MSYRLPKGRNALPDFSFHRPGLDAVNLHDRKLAAWALSVGASVPLAYPERDVRPHRGELADIDLRLAGPDPGRRSFVDRVIFWLGKARRTAGRREPTAKAMSATDEDGIGTVV